MTNRMHFHNRSVVDDFIQRFFYDRYNAFYNEEMTSNKRFHYRIKSKLAWDFYDNDADFRADIVWKSLRLSRIEPENPYLFHTNIPSARGLNSNEVFYIEVENNQLTVSVYHREMDQFVVIYFGPTEYKEKSNELWILFNKGNIGNVYGDFGYVLSLLDTGHFINQTSLIASHHHETISISYDDFDDLGLNLTNMDFHILAKIKLSKKLPSFSNKLLTKEFSRGLCTYTVNHAGDFRTSTLNDYLQLLLKGSRYSFIENNNVDCIRYFKNLDTAMFNRTSNQSPQGYSSFLLHKDPKEVSQLIEYICVCLQSLTIHRSFSVLLLDLERKGNDTGVFISNDTIEEVSLKGFSKKRILQDGQDYLELNDCKYIIYTMIHNDIFHIQSGLNYSLIKSAEIIHAISLYLTELSYDTRPMKNINERYLEDYFKLEDKLVTYMLIAGKSHNYNLHLKI